MLDPVINAAPCVGKPGEKGVLTSVKKIMFFVCSRVELLSSGDIVLTGPPPSSPLNFRFGVTRFIIVLINGI